MPEVDVFPNPARKPPVSMKYKAVVSPVGKVTSARFFGIGYGSTRALARKRANADYRRKRGRVVR